MSLYPALFRNILMPAYEIFRGKKLLKYIDEYQSHLSWNKEQISEWQWQKLQLLLKHAYENTEFYPQHWQSVGINSYLDIKNLDDFAKLPPINKSDIRENYQKFVGSHHHDNIVKATGGSTGQPFSFELDIQSNTRREAVMWRGYNWLNAGLGVKTLYLWGTDLGNPAHTKKLKNELYHSFYNRKMLNSFAMNRSNMSQYIEQINEYQANAIVSYVNPLYELSRYILENNCTVTPPKSILTGAEQLHDFQREVIERAFKAPVYNTFGCREFMLIAAECQKEKHLHINSDHLVVEIIDANNQPITDKSGEMVITDLFNYGMPFIRYINGDRATMSQNQCSCGNPLPIIGSVDGRKLDIIKTTNGASIPGELFPHMLKEYKGVERFQVIQKELTSITIKLVTNSEFTKNNQQTIISDINKYSKGALEINIQQVSDIPLTKTGKHRVTICEVK
ncbi:MAG: phenylacetate--CoA ligase family protein [Colwellia sp.]